MCYSYFRSIEKVLPKSDSSFGSLATTALYIISENAGLYYLFLCLVPLCLYFEFFLPEVNEEEDDYLRNFAKAEIVLVLCQPLIILLFVGILYLFGFPLCTIFTYIILLVFMLQFPGFIVLRNTNRTVTNMRYDIISKSVRWCYLVCTFSLYAFICAISGPVTFNFQPTGLFYHFPSQNNRPMPDLRMVDRNGVYSVVDMNRGYLTFFLYYFAPQFIFFFIMFYLSHLYLTTSVRCLMYYVYFLIDMFGNIFNWITK